MSGPTFKGSKGKLPYEWQRSEPEILRDGSTVTNCWLEEASLAESLSPPLPRTGATTLHARLTERAGQEYGTSELLFGTPFGGEPSDSTPKMLIDNEEIVASLQNSNPIVMKTYLAKRVYPSGEKGKTQELLDVLGTALSLRKAARSEHLISLLLRGISEDEKLSQTYAGVLGILGNTPDNETSADQQSRFQGKGKERDMSGRTGLAN
ncbi:hypothetical protein M231_06841 [Tremella mesenterica]|uniref:Uncharacterized protein n=1 Tax=Tremella mesenterica TaxID=5217 RepID=A0A4Q1BCS7_TREME|nr:hypothetical protein M231_06841 [Tremella mesenterica]